jgi:hypothetical protein
VTGRTVQLEVYGFGPDAPFEGWLVSALERLEAGGSVRVVDALFVKTDRSTGDAVVFDARGEGLGMTLVPLLDFRLDAGARARETAAALADPAGAGVPSEVLRELLGTLEPGAALAAILLEHVEGAALDRAVLDDAVARANGAPVLRSAVEARRLSELTTELRTAAGRR